MNVLITSVGTSTSIGIIKNIRKYRTQWRIIGTDINDYGFTAGSQMVDKYYQVPLAVDHNYKDVISRIICQEHIDYLWPVNDQEIRNVSAWDGAGCDCIIPKSEAVSLVGDKLLCTEEVSHMGIACPKMPEWGRDGRYIIRKRHGVGSSGIRFLEGRMQEGIVDDDEFAQEWVNGQEYTVDILSDRRGNPKYIIPRMRLEVKSGVSTKAQIVKEDDMIDSAKRILQKIKLPGFSNIQFIRSKEGINFFIEINPRIGGCSSASLLSAEKMFPAFLAMVEGNGAADMELNSGVKWNSVITRYYEEIMYEPV